MDFLHLFVFFDHAWGMGILIPPIGIELAAHAMEAGRLSLWVPKEVQQFLFFKRLHLKTLSY